MIKRLIAIGAACLLTACTSAATQNETNVPGRNPDVISAEELGAPEIASLDALQAVQRLRPRFLMTHGQVSSSNPAAGAVQVSVDGGSLQPVTFLRGMRATSVKEIRYYGPTDASQKFGTAAAMGSVLVVTGR